MTGMHEPKSTEIKHLNDFDGDLLVQEYGDGETFRIRSNWITVGHLRTFAAQLYERFDV